MRTVGSRCPFAGLGLGLDLPPLPIAATLVIATGAWTCTFDKPLQPAALNFANWTMRASGDQWAATSATSSGAVVSGVALIGLASAGPDVIFFTPPPFDVLSLSGLPAVAFADFPLVVT